jgi:hypothetical protein
MRMESQSSVTRARVRGGELVRHEVRRLDGGRAWAIAGGLGLPRLWRFAIGRTLDAVGASVEATRGSAGATRLDHALGAARMALARACDMLIERDLPDVALIVMLVDGGHLHVLCAGAGRVYVQRGATPERLTPREDVKGGLLLAEATRADTPLEPGDLVLAGSASAFSVRAVARLAAVLEEDPHATPSVLAGVLTEPAAQAGLGAAAVALRVA